MALRYEFGAQNHQFEYAKHYKKSVLHLLTVLIWLPAEVLSGDATAFLCGQSSHQSRTDLLLLTEVCTLSRHTTGCSCSSRL